MTPLTFYPGFLTFLLGFISGVIFLAVMIVWTAVAEARTADRLMRLNNER